MKTSINIKIEIKVMQILIVFQNIAILNQIKFDLNYSKFLLTVSVSISIFVERRDIY